MENAKMNDDLMIIDATKATEDFHKEVDAVADEDSNTLAEIMGEGVQDNSVAEREEAIEGMIAQFALGHIVQLKKPITLMTPTGPQTLSEVTFSQELEARHIQNMPMQMDAWKFSHQLALIGACTGLRAAELSQLATYDVVPLMEVAASFFSVGPKIGS